MQLANTLDHPMDRLRVLTNDVGGAFGLKGGIFREDFCLALASKQLGRPVKWIEDRNEHLTASGHAREEMVTAELAVTDAGDILGIRARLILDQGAYPGLPFPAAAFTGLITMLLPGPYKVQGYTCEYLGCRDQQVRVRRLSGPLGDGDLGPGAAARHRRPRAQPGSGRGTAPQHDGRGGGRAPDHRAERARDFVPPVARSSVGADRLRSLPCRTKSRSNRWALPRHRVRHLHRGRARAPRDAPQRGFVRRGAGEGEAGVRRPPRW